ncbi:MAG: hypothetical protein QHH19_03140 [Candidatus Thermoplasmatota archaeon]|jgi:hypothetical protein|nr:hypothetical protein [Candidatus Thermoplasmatota archaeon]
MSSLSGCILNQIFGTSFSLVSYNIVDDKGFAGLSIVFTNTGTVTIKIYNPDGNIVDSELFLSSNKNHPNNAILYLASYRETALPGQYKLVVYDKNDKKIYEKTFNIVEPSLSILSCKQSWWNDNLRNEYYLIGLTMDVYNRGDTPVYPYKVELVVDNQTFSGLVLPNVIMPKENGYLNCSMYKTGKPKDNVFVVYIKDVIGNVMAYDSFYVDLYDNLVTKKFTWKYSGRDRTIMVPYPKFLLDYYVGLDRILNQDYSTYVFDFYDDNYMDLFVDRLLYGYYVGGDVDKINFVASFVQNLNYSKDSLVNESFEYPRYPIETLFYGKGGGDCEDKAILAASILSQMGYDVALFRFTNHMAVGVRLSKNLSSCEVYSDGYYFLETTSIGGTLGYVPNDYKSRLNLTIYPISSRPLLVHSWFNNSLTIFTNTELGDFVKVKAIIENLGSGTAEDILFKGAFYTVDGQEIYSKTSLVSALEPGMREKVVIIVNIPKELSTTFKTRVYLDGEFVDEKEASSSFP